MSQTPTIPPIVNSTMKFVLRSPVHGMVSKTILLITFTGRKSGKTYSTPVSYSQTGDQVAIFTHASGGRTCAAVRRSHCASRVVICRDCRSRSPRISKPLQPGWLPISARCRAMRLITV